VVGRQGVYGGDVAGVDSGVGRVGLSAQVFNVETVCDGVEGCGDGRGWSSVFESKECRCGGAGREYGEDSSGNGFNARTGADVGVEGKDSKGDQSGGFVAPGVGSVGGKGRVIFRGKNWERNNERRVKKKLAKLNRKNVSETPSSGVKGYFSSLSDDVQKQLKQTRAEMLIEKNKRELIEEQRKLKYLNSPMAAVAEAMRAMGVVEKIAKKENDSKVLGWARTVSEGYASSFSGTPVSSEGSVSVESSVSQRYEKAARTWGLKKVNCTGSEGEMLKHGLVSVEQLVLARAKAGRVLNSRDFSLPDAPVKLSEEMRWKLRLSESQDLEC